MSNGSKPTLLPLTLDPFPDCQPIMHPLLLLPPSCLPTVGQNKGLVRADKLQQLHTMYNLAQLLGLLEGPSGAAGAAGGAQQGQPGAGGGALDTAPAAAPMLRDASLPQQVQELK